MNEKAERNPTRPAEDQLAPRRSGLFHVVDLGYPGHSQTTTPRDYPMAANRIGADLAGFIQTPIGEPVYITGNSSDGLRATWVGYQCPGRVKAALFSSEYLRIKQTIASPFC